MDGVGKICWLVDVKGWAFENRAKAISRLLPNYEHDVVMLKKDNIVALDDYDIIICDFLPWLEFICPGVDRKKIILGLRSFRALDIYERINDVPAA